MSRSVQDSITRLEEIAGGKNVVTDGAQLAARDVCGMRPSAVVRPADSAQVAEILRFAAAEKLAVIPCGGGTKLGIGSPPLRYDIALDLSRLNRILAYDPQDLTLGVEPGVRIEDLLRTLAEQKQFLPLSVPFADHATIGGVVAANSSSPTRHAYGSVRDFCLGMEFVTGEGTQAKSGGRVVKNVTGYDLHKLLIGSLGTLAVITRVNFRTFPLPPAQGMFVASFQDAEAAFAFCRAIARSVLMPQMLEVADPAAGRFIFSGETSARIASMQWSVVISAAGQASVVDRYARELGHLAAAANAAEFLPLGDSEHSSVFARIREFPRLVLEAAPDAAIFRIGVAPTAMPSLLKDLREIANRYESGFAGLTRASGIVYAAFLPRAGNETRSVFNANAVKEVFHVCALPANGASAMLEWCPSELKRAGAEVWGPERQDFGLMQRVKNAFDPHHVLAPGRFAGGI
ncbi:MAG TPA: FAD-binding oxidoreductase [Candidatus Acidoferrales bacterium]|nr:FAD-binding oxidoreductase [Candidatus Acidoferrales bacterium]